MLVLQLCSSVFNTLKIKFELYYERLIKVIGSFCDSLFLLLIQNGTNTGNTTNHV